MNIAVVRSFDYHCCIFNDFVNETLQLFFEQRMGETMFCIKHLFRQQLQMDCKIISIANWIPSYHTFISSRISSSPSSNGWMLRICSSWCARSRTQPSSASIITGSEIRAEQNPLNNKPNTDKCIVCLFDRYRHQQIAGLKGVRERCLNWHARPSINECHPTTWS